MLVLQETQRINSTHANIREVISDTNISAGGKDYMLKKGNYVQLHCPPILRSKELWLDICISFALSPRFLAYSKMPSRVLHAHHRARH